MIAKPICTKPYLMSLVFSLIFSPMAVQAAKAPELARWRVEARASTLVRDDHGIAHIHGHTDADAVFAMSYAQAEDDFNRVETNYLTALGRTAEADGEGAIWADLRARLYVDPEDLKTRYDASPLWLRKLMVAWADGLNAYLASHPNTHPKVISQFEPWMALSFSEGSIGGDIERVDLQDLQAFYGAPGEPQVARAKVIDEEPRGSNGIAIAPKLTRDGHALLLINPHTTFFFRSEAKVQSDQGLNVYGASTWGQFFVYQGFNAHAGWMHTSSGVDAVDRFSETVTRQDGHFAYRYGKAWRPITTKSVRIAYRTASGVASRDFTAYFTHRGPIIAGKAGRWVSFAMMYRPVEALSQSYLRTKATTLKAFLKVAQLKANSSNNTLFADDQGEIAYLHPQFIPRRDDRFDYRKPVDGTDPATDWRGLHALDEAPRVINPRSGYVFNTNNWPYSETDPRKAKLAEPVAVLKAWDDRWSAGSVATSLAVFWGDDLWSQIADEARANGDNAMTGIDHDTTAEMKLAALDRAVDRLGQDFGGWKTPWSEINRFQRLTGDIVQPFSDDKPSLAVPFTSANWGSLASFGAKRYPGTKRYYGTSGNSFVAVIEFGPKVRAVAVSAGGESGDPKSPHFIDQAERYAKGDLRPVYFYRSDLKGHIEATYHPAVGP